ncbi:MAG: glycoside hydrolase family 43 protein [Clostridia bacterium]|nr:glycoside hydrolase family 43 protein [Clostridia bacterium]
MVCPYREIDKIGDPFALYDKELGRYYMYCTGGKYKCWSSDTMKKWEPHGDSYLVTERSFGTRCYWAPEVYKYRGAYYMVYSAANDAKRHSIGLARSECPTGPFTDVSSGPLLSPGYSVIDASLFFDDDGRVYLYYSRDNCENFIDGKRVSQSYGVELTPELDALIGEPVLLATPTNDWELISGNVIWNEGPCVFKRGGKYYLLFSVNYYASVDYSVGYAVSDSPLGVYTKPADNPILQGDGITTSGTGHCNIVPSPDGTETYIVYHSHSSVTNTNNPIADRTPCCDKLIVRADGSLVVNGPSVAKQPLPSGAAGLYKKTRGVTVASDYETKRGSLLALTDGIVAYTAHSREDVYAFSGTGCITVSYDKPIKLNSLWIYGTYEADKQPRSVHAVINGKYETDELYFTDSVSADPVIITGASLPSEERVIEIKLCFTSRTANADMTLSELITVEE